MNARLLRNFVKSSLSGLLLSVLAAALTSHVTACDNSDRGAGNAFVGTWSCPSLPAGARTIVISEYIDNSLSITNESDGGGAGPFCQSDAWSFSGSTATMEQGISCLGGASGTEVILVNDFSLTVNGKSLTVTGNETLSSGGEEPDGRPTDTYTKQTLSLSSACTKQ